MRIKGESDGANIYEETRLTFHCRVRYQVRSAMALDYVSESNKLMALIKQYDGMSV
jgi:hypothetical protein